jgi:hypothetical protein
MLDSEWIAPSLWKSEFRNILTLYLRKGILTWDVEIDLFCFQRRAYVLRDEEYFRLKILTCILPLSKMIRNHPHSSTKTRKLIPAWCSSLKHSCQGCGVNTAFVAPNLYAPVTFFEMILRTGFLATITRLR